MHINVPRDKERKSERERERKEERVRNVRNIVYRISVRKSKRWSILEFALAE